MSTVRFKFRTISRGATEEQIQDAFNTFEGMFGFFPNEDQQKLLRDHKDFSYVAGTSDFKGLTSKQIEAQNNIRTFPAEIGGTVDKLLPTMPGGKEFNPNKPDAIGSNPVNRQSTIRGNIRRSGPTGILFPEGGTLLGGSANKKSLLG